MSMHLERIKKIISSFDEGEKVELVTYYKDIARNVLMNDKKIGASKVDLLIDIRTIAPDYYTEISKEVIQHKVLQTRALILDLISSDYSKDIECIYKEEPWMDKIVRDIENTFLGSEEGESLLYFYNQILVEEFEDIFISKVEHFGSNGNQLIVNMYYYERFILQYLEYDFTTFINKLKNQMDKDKLLKEDEYCEILKDCKM